MPSSSGTFSSRNRAVGQAQRETERETSADPFLQLPRIRPYRNLLSSPLWCSFEQLSRHTGRNEGTIKRKRKVIRMLMDGTPAVWGVFETVCLHSSYTLFFSPLSITPHGVCSMVVSKASGRCSVRLGVQESTLLGSFPVSGYFQAQSLF